MPPSDLTVDLPAVDSKISRKTVENPMVKMAPIGLSQKDSCSKRTCHPISLRSLEPLEGSGRRRRSGVRSWLRRGQIQVDVLQRHPGHGQPRQDVAGGRWPNR